MSAWSERRRHAPLNALRDRAAAFVLRPPTESDVCARPHAPASAPPGGRAAEPADRPYLSVVPDDPLPAGPDPFAPLRPVVAVVGLAPRAGASTVARALAARLACFDGDNAALLFSDDVPRLGLTIAGGRRLGEEVRGFGCEGWRASGRVCVVPLSEPLAEWAADPPSPVVADLGHGPPVAGALALAGHVVLVAPPGVEPALAAAVEGSLRREGHGVSLVVNRAAAEPGPELERALMIPEAWLAAALSRACRAPRGALAAAATELAERCLAEVVT